MKLYRLSFALVAATALTLSSCRSGKSVTKENITAGEVTTNGASSTQTRIAKYVETAKAINVNQDNLTAKIRATVSMGGKSVSTSGQLKMRRDEVVQISLTDPVLGLMEVGRMEFSKNNLLIIDRINNQYVDVPYSDVSYLKAANIDFNMFQSLFWNEVFQPGEQTPKASAFTLYDNPGGNVSLDYTDKYLRYAFSLLQPSGQLSRTIINDTMGQGYTITMSYANFTNVGNKQFPKNLNLALKGNSMQVSLELELSSIDNSSKWEPHTQPSSKYTKVGAERLFRSLIR